VVGSAFHFLLNHNFNL